MKDNQHEQLFPNLDPLVEEISDDKSASITGGATSPLAGRVPRFGSKTFPTVYTTTSQFNDISIRLTENPYDVKVKAVRADGTGDVSSYQRTIPANNHGVFTVAADVRDGTRFKLDFEGDSGYNYFDIAGRTSY